MSVKLVETAPIYESNYRDLIATLRLVADNLESGNYGKAISAAMVVRLGDYAIEVFGLGLGDIDTSIALLEQGKAKLVRMLGGESK